MRERRQQSRRIEEKLIRAPEVVRRTGLSRATVRRMVSLGAFPAPVRLSARTVAWRAGEIERWIRERPSTR